ncbi:MAG: glycosyltransferase family 4 protein [Aestuariivirga sp.]
MRILHVFRTPVGGLFRHVRDLARGQSGMGHDVGVLCDSSTGGETAAKLLDSIKPYCSLGIERRPISRLPGVGDISGALAARAAAKELKADIIHGHGAKGGLYARLAGLRLDAKTFYTPHGGSLHYNWSSPSGALYLLAEKLAARIGTGLVFVCDYERNTFDAKIGLAGKPNTVVYNGLWPEEFAAVEPEPDAADFLFIGDMRTLKGVDVLLEALALIRRARPCRLCLVGDGPDLDQFRRQSQTLGLQDAVRFAGRMAAREAFAKGRILVIPSRAESFPYIVIEAIAAGMPLITTSVGGIPEIMPAASLVKPGDVMALAKRLEVALADQKGTRRQSLELAERNRERLDASAMARSITDFYAKVS